MSWLSYLGIALCSAALEIGWISSVRSVTANRMWIVAGNAVVMQGISNASTLILVSNGWTAIASIIGAGLGAILCMRFAPSITLIGLSANDSPIIIKTETQ